MYDNLTLDQFLDNPMGKGSMAIPNRQLLKQDLTNRFKKIKGIKSTIYKDKEDYYFHIVIPSESERNNTYDVVIQFYPGENNEFVYDNFIKRYNIKFFSNCPSFTYTYAQTFDQYGFLIDILRNKYRTQVLNNMPVIRNPSQIISFEKSIYFACLYINDSFRMKNKLYLNQESKRLDRVEINKIIRNTDYIEMEIKKENAILADKRKQEKKEKPKTSVRGKEKITGKVKYRKDAKGKIVPKAKIVAKRKRK